MSGRPWEWETKMRSITDLVAKAGKGRTGGAFSRRTPGQSTAMIVGAGGLASMTDFGRDLIFNELLGVDDFKRAAEYGGKGEFGKMLKSLASGAFELGTTVIPGAQIGKAVKVGKLVQMARASNPAADLTQALTKRQLRRFERTGGDVLRASPIGGRIMSSVPGLTRSVDGVTTLTGAGRGVAGTSRVGQAGYTVLNPANALAEGIGAPAVPVGMALEQRQERQNQELLDRQRAALRAMMDERVQGPFGGTFVGGYR